MNKIRIRYFEQEDVLHLVLAEEPESRSLELSPNITVELNDQNELIGVEILNAGAFGMPCWSLFRRRPFIYSKHRRLRSVFK